MTGRTEPVDGGNTMNSMQRTFKVRAITDNGAQLKKVVLEQVTPEPDWPYEVVIYTAADAQPDEKFTLTLTKTE